MIQEVIVLGNAESNKQNVKALTKFLLGNANSKHLYFKVLENSLYISNYIFFEIANKLLINL